MLKLELLWLTNFVSSNHHVNITADRNNRWKKKIKKKIGLYFRSHWFLFQIII